MRIVVTGCAGFIGSHLGEALLEAGHEVVGIDAFLPYYPRPLKEGNLRPLLAHPSFTFHEADLRTADLEPLVEGAEVVVNQAAMPGLPRSWADFELYSSCNLLAIQRLAVASHAAGIRRFVQASTSSIYGANAVGDERLEPRPVSPYGVTKLAAEHVLRAYMDSFGLPVVVLRYFSIFGPRQRPDMAYHLFIEKLRRADPITVYGDGLQSRSNTYIEDCVRGTVQAIAAAEPGEAYNIGGGRSITLRDAVAILAEALQVEPRVRQEPPRVGDQRHTRADTSKARAVFGFEPEVSPEEGLRRQVAWHLSHLPASSPAADESEPVPDQVAAP